MTTAVQLAQSVAPGVSLGFKNRIINGQMQIDQRNAGAAVTFNTAGTYLVDRWTQNNGGGATITGQQSSTAPSGFTNSLLITTTSGGAPSSGILRIFAQYVEGYNVSDLGWGTSSAQSVTVSFCVRSSVTGTFSVYVTNSAFNRSQVQTYTINAANTWEYKSVTFSGDTSGTWLTNNGVGLTLGFDIGSGTNFNATAGVWNSGFYARTSGSTTISATTGSTFYITGVQLEVGTTATPFEFRDYGRELIMCQRYYEVSYASSDNVDFTSSYFVTSNNRATWWFKVQKRAAPTFALASGAAWTNITPTVLTNTAHVHCYGGDYFYVITGSPYGVSLTASAEL